MGGAWRYVFKDPVTDTGKRSQKGLLGPARDGGGWRTAVEEATG